jgi:four helix bundle protein
MIMATVKRFEELELWQKARMFCRNIFRITNYVKFSQDFRLKDQIRASSGSIMDNIAEGFERSGNKEFVQFLYIAKGSCGESRSQLYRALDFEYLPNDEFGLLQQEAIDLSQNISNFIKYLKNSEMKGYKYNH